MEITSIVNYLSERGLECVWDNSGIKIYFEVTDSKKSFCKLTCDSGMFGGSNYTVIYEEKLKPFSLQRNEAEELQKKLNFDYSLNCHLNVSNNTLEFSGSLMTLDNKKPEIYCYDFLLKDFIFNIKESYPLWRKYIEEVL